MCAGVLYHKFFSHLSALSFEQANSVIMQEVDAPGWLHRFIIGRKGQNVQKITQDLPRVHVEFNFDLNKIILEGPPGEVSQAAEAFMTFTEDLVCGRMFVSPSCWYIPFYIFVYGFCCCFVNMLWVFLSTCSGLFVNM